MLSREVKAPASRLSRTDMKGKQVRPLRRVTDPGLHDACCLLARDVLPGEPDRALVPDHPHD